MARRKRRNHSPTFKAQVAIAALKGDKTLAELAQQYDIHPNEILKLASAFFAQAELDRHTKK